LSISKITLVSTGQPSVNPRLVKEADAFSEAGYDVTAVYSHWSDWALGYDKKLLSKKKWKAILAGGNIFENKASYLITRIKQKLFSMLAHRLGFGNGFAERTLSRAYDELLSEAKRTKADLYIAHNLGSLPIAVKAAKFNKSKAGFDAEDFHRQETTDDQNSFDYKIKKYIEDKYIPQIQHFTAASPLIAEAYQKLFPGKNVTVINNVFPFQSLNLLGLGDGLKLFWFSQTIGPDRGLEEIFEALSQIKDKNWELGLLGNLSEQHMAYFEQVVKQFKIQNSKFKIKFLEPVHPEEVILVASTYDIGLALEQKKPFNRNICLTNKIFTYLNAGLAVIATDTLAQKKLMDEHPEIGKTYEVGNVISLVQILNHYLDHKEALIKTKQAAFLLAQNELNWQKESLKLLALIKNPNN
jgi:glycosyltransferase involved in cell wall biosynthesis